jgi:cell division protein FtsL
MGLEIIKDGVVVRQDNKPSLEEVISQQEQIINDLKNQIKDLQSKLYILQNEK